MYFMSLYVYVCVGVSPSFMFLIALQRETKWADYQVLSLYGPNLICFYLLE